MDARARASYFAGDGLMDIVLGMMLLFVVGTLTTGGITVAIFVPLLVIGMKGFKDKITAPRLRPDEGVTGRDPKRDLIGLLAANIALLFLGILAWALVQRYGVAGSTPWILASVGIGAVIVVAGIIVVAVRMRAPRLYAYLAAALAIVALAAWTDIGFEWPMAILSLAIIVVGITYLTRFMRSHPLPEAAGTGH